MLAIILYLFRFVRLLWDVFLANDREDSQAKSRERVRAMSGEANGIEDYVNWRRRVLF
jgi:hypothetical protein